MEKVPLVLVVLGSMFLSTGIASALINPLLQHSQTIVSHGTIAYENSTEPQPTENNPETYVDSTGYVPMIIGVGLLSIGFLDGIVKKKHK
jgi:hypothetical protein